MADLMEQLGKCREELRGIYLPYPEEWPRVEKWFLRWKWWFLSNVPEMVGDIENLVMRPPWQVVFGEPALSPNLPFEPLKRVVQTSDLSILATWNQALQLNSKLEKQQRERLLAILSGFEMPLQEKMTAAALPSPAPPQLRAAAGPSQPVQVFVSYAREDADLRAELNMHLASLRNNGSIAEWHDGLILPGENWDATIRQHLEAASVIVMLVSARFLASEYCQGVEVTRALARHDAGTARVIPVLVRATDWQSSPLSRLQALPDDARAVTSWTNRDEAWTNVATGIRRVVEEIAASRR